MEEKTIFEQMEVQYEEVDGLLYPILPVEVKTESNEQTGKYGDCWIHYMQENHFERYRSLIRFGKLQEKAVEVNEEAYELLDQMLKTYLEKHPAQNPGSTMEMWKLREQAKSMVEEFIFQDIVYKFH
jgi:hypothetical protein